MTGLTWLILGAGLCLQALVWPSLLEAEWGAVVLGLDRTAIKPLDRGKKQSIYLSECVNFLSSGHRLLMRLAERFSNFSQPRPPEGGPHEFGWGVGFVFP